MNKRKRAAVLGFDCAMPSLLEKHIAEGVLPTFKRVIEAGVMAENCLAPYPTITPPNWASIATGAWPGTHQVTDYWMPVPGTTPENANTVQAFSSDRVKAEYLWDAADKAGKKCIVLNYPGSWPSHMKNGIMVGGSGLSVGANHDGLWGLEIRVSLCGNQLVTTGFYPNAIRGSFAAADGWENLQKPEEEPLEMAVELNFPQASVPPTPTTWYVLAEQTGAGRYDRVSLSPSRDITSAFCTLLVGQWSSKIVTKIGMRDGTERQVCFRCKLLELAEDASDFRLLITAMIDVSGWTSPTEIAAKLSDSEGVPIAEGVLGEYSVGWYDLDTYVELQELHDLWLGDAAVKLLSDGDWDLFFMHSHPIDWMLHMVLNDLEPATNSDEARRSKAGEVHRKIYESQDRMLSRILEVLPRDTLTVLVSDHGATADGPFLNPYDILVPAGLTSLMSTGSAGGIEDWAAARIRKRGWTSRPDVSQSKALPQRICYVYVNLKGRDPEGIVEPEDYGKIQQQIIDALLTYVDPKTGMRPVALALAKEDARILGLYGEGIGDVVYALYPWFGSQHGQKLPTAKWGIGDLRALLVLNGPGIKKGRRLERTVHLVDLVPTLCYLTDLPLPDHVEGAVLYQLLEDPDFKRKEVAELLDALARTEAALSQQSH